MFQLFLTSIVLGVLTGLSMDFYPLAENTHTALGLFTGFSSGWFLLIFLRDLFFGVKCEKINYYKLCSFIKCM